MAQCLQHLHDKPEYESDEVLVQLVRAQRMNEMIAHFHQRDEFIDVRPSSQSWTANLDSLLADLYHVPGRGSQHRRRHCR
jgi:hypothetical protein